MSCQSREAGIAIVEALSRARRPRLLLAAARAGMGGYQRENDLKRVLRLPATPPPGLPTLRALMAAEAELEALRADRLHTAGEAWRPSRHVEVMIALMAEARLLVRPAHDSAESGPDAGAKAVGFRRRAVVSALSPAPTEVMLRAKASNRRRSAPHEAWHDTAARDTA